MLGPRYNCVTASKGLVQAKEQWEASSAAIVKISRCLDEKDMGDVNEQLWQRLSDVLGECQLSCAYVSGQTLICCCTYVGPLPEHRSLEF